MSMAYKHQVSASSLFVDVQTSRFLLSQSFNNVLLLPCLTWTHIKPFTPLGQQSRQPRKNRIEISLLSSSSWNYFPTAKCGWASRTVWPSNTLAASRLLIQRAITPNYRQDGTKLLACADWRCWLRRAARSRHDQGMPSYPATQLPQVGNNTFIHIHIKFLYRQHGEIASKGIVRVCLEHKKRWIVLGRVSYNNLN